MVRLVILKAIISLLAGNTSRIKGQKTEPGQCDSGPIRPETWNQRHIDDYLKNYPQGHTQNLEAYAIAQGSNDFRCGIGEACLAGQVCFPVTAPSWHVLFAAQEWNFFANRMFQAFSFAVNLVKETTSDLIDDLIPSDTAHNVLIGAELVDGLFVSLVAIWVLFFSPTPMIVLSSVFLKVSLFGGTATTLAIRELATFCSSRPKHTQMVLLSNVVYELTQWEIHARQKLGELVQKVIETPISSPGGIAELLSNGAFFPSDTSLNSQTLLSEYQAVLQARALLTVLRAEHVFILRGQDRCNGRGKNGAQVGKDVLSWCDGSGMMMKLVQVKGTHKLRKKIHGGSLIGYKYGFSAEYLTNSAWMCQQKYGIGFDPYKNGTLPLNLQADCVINLPVCDATRTDIQVEKAKHGWVIACRGVGNLPI